MRRLLQSVRRPTMVRRVLCALLLAFLLVGAALITVDFITFKRTMARDPGIKQLGSSLASALARLDDERDAGKYVAITADQLNADRRDAGMLPGDILFQLRRVDGEIAYRSPALGDITLPVERGEVAILDVAGRSHWVVQTGAGPWRLYVAEPRVEDVTVLRWIGKGLLPSLLIGFSLVVIPLWVAVRRGMRPLADLAERLAARPAHDLSPIDMTPKQEELKSLVEAFEQLLAQLRQHVQRERAFVHDAAHELRTPMAAIATQAHVLAQAPDFGERQQASDALHRALDRASHLSRQLLDLAVLDDGHPRTPQRLDLSAVVQQALAQTAPQAMALGLELSMEAPDQLFCMLDRVAFESVLGNLLENALRYVPAGGCVVVSLAQAEGRLTLAVADDGPGIPPHARERAFERFWRGQAHESTVGSGLGLAIVRQAASCLHGRVHIEDGLHGRGIRFVLQMPA